MNTVPYFSKPRDLEGPKIANKDAATYVRQHLAFHGSNLYARIHPTTIGHLYVVYSYRDSWPLLIARVIGEPTARAAWYINGEYFSRSTSAHMAKVSRALTDDEKTLAVTGLTKDMLNIIREWGIA